MWYFLNTRFMGVGKFIIRNCCSGTESRNFENLFNFTFMEGGLITKKNNNYAEKNLNVRSYM